VRSVVGWHVAFWLLLAIMVLAALTSETMETSRRLAALLLLGVLALAYVATVHRPTLREDSGATAYLVVAVLVTTALCWVDPRLSLVLYLMYAHVWLFNESLRRGAAFAVALTLGALGGFTAHEGWTTEALVTNTPAMVVSLLFSLLLGFWISRIIDQSRDRAELIEELEATRSELALADHARGVMAERERVAREIHDTLAQGFTSIVMLAQAATAAGGRDPDLATSRLRAIEDVARENLAEARALVAAFTPVGLENTTLLDAVRRLGDRFERETGVAVTVEDDLREGAALSRDQEVVVLRAVQEALANVRRHARAGRVTVRLVADGAGSRVEIGDDGVGFVPGAADAGFGLAGMRSRVAEVGGEVDVASAPGRGTRVTVRLPAVAAS
jgi:signal transduction histidine kinase